MTTLDVWQETFACKDNNEALRALSRLRELPEHINRLVAELEYPEAAKRALSPIEQAIGSNNLDELWVHKSRNFGLGAMTALEIVSGFLSRDTPESEIPEDAIMRLSSQARQLLAKTRNSDLPDDLKTFVAQQVQEIDEAIRRYAIEGVKPITDAAEKTLASTIFRRDIWDRLGSTELGRKTRDLAIHALIWATAAGAGAKAIGDVADTTVKVTAAIEAVGKTWGDLTGSDKALENPQSEDREDIPDAVFKDATNSEEL